MILIVASFVDLSWKIIPGSLTVFGVILALAASAIYPQMHALYTGFHKGGGAWMEAIDRWIAQVPPVDGLCASFAGMMAGVALILVVRFLGSVIFRREAMGLGDAKLMAVIGGFLGWRAVPVAFLVASFVGAVVGILSYFRTRDREIPLGPFLALGALVVMLWGNALIHWWFVGLMGLSEAPLILPQFPQ
jgi:leader peptidase (prepilin peptidase)/N-methyltransferase